MSDSSPGATGSRVSPDGRFSEASQSNGRAYLDHAASSPMRPEATAAMIAELGQPGNPSSTHAAGRRARKVLEEARESIAADLGAHPTEVLFTSGGTEADNIAVTGSWLARRAQDPARNRIVTSAVEHPAVSKAAEAAAAAGAELTTLAVDTAGVIDLLEATEALNDQVAVASVQWANAETGVAQPIVELVELAGPRGVWSHSDAVHAMTSTGIDFGAVGLDLMSLSAHKLGGPVGVGALLAKKAVRPAAIGFGGAQERELRSGTVPVALAAAFAAALHAATSERGVAAARFADFRSRVIKVAEGIEGTRTNGEPSGTSSVVNLSFEGLRSDDLLLLLDATGIDVSAGSACRAGVSRPSEVLVAMGLSDQLASAALRISFGHSTTVEDLARLADALPDAVHRARSAY